MIHELADADGIALGELVRKGQVTPLDLVERAVCRIEAVNPRLNAVIHRMYDEARRVAETLKIKRTKSRSAPGPFTGVPFLTGQPAMSVPLFWNGDHLPVGVQFAGRFGDEGLLIRLASQLERSRPWRDRTPPIRCSD